MPTRDYEIRYTTTTAATAAANVRALRDQVLALDAAVTASAPKLAGLGAGNQTVAALQAQLAALQAQLAKVQGQATTTGTALTSLATSTRTTGTSAGTASGAFLGFASQIAAVAGPAALARIALREVAAAIRTAREEAEGWAAANLKLLDTERELATLKGLPAPTKDLTRDQIELAQATRMSVDEAKRYAVMWESTKFAAEQKGNWRLNAEQQRDLEEQAGLMATRVGLSPETMGMMAASLGISQPVESADQALAELGQMQVMVQEGVGNVKPIYVAIQKLRGTMVRPEGGGAAKSMAELAAIVSTTTTDQGTPAAAARAVEQVWRELAAPKTAEAQATFQRLGMQPGDDYPTRLRKLKPILDAGAAPGGPGELAALQNAGLRNSYANLQIVKAVHALDLLDERWARMQSGGDAAQVRAKNLAFAGSDAGRARLAETEMASAEFERGVPRMSLATERKRTEAAMLKARELGTTESGLRESATGLFGLTKLVGGQTGRQLMVDQRVWETLEDRARLAGVDFDTGGISPDLSSERGLSLYSETVAQVEAAEKAKGITPLAPGERAGEAALARAGGRVRPGFAPAAVPAPPIRTRPGVVVPAGGAGAPGGPGAPGAGGAPGGVASVDLSPMAAPLKELVEIERAKLRDRGRAGRGLDLPAGDDPFTPIRA